MWEDRIVIKALRVEKNWSSRRFLEEFASKAWCRSSLDRFIKTIDAELPVDGVIGRGCRRWPVKGLQQMSRVSRSWSAVRRTHLAPTRALGKLSGNYLYSRIVVCCRRYMRWTISRSATYDFFQVVCLQQSCWSYVAPSSVLSVYYDKIWIKFASHHLLLYVVYMCQKSLNLLMHSNVTSENVSGFTLAGPPCMYCSPSRLRKRSYFVVIVTLWLRDKKFTNTQHKIQAVTYYS